MTDYSAQIKTVRGVLDYAGAEFNVSERDIRDRFQALSEQGVAQDEARWIIARELLTYNGYDEPEETIKAYRRRRARRRTTPIQELSANSLADLHVVVDYEFDTANESIAQAGVFKDRSGEVPFTIWESSGVDPLEVGESYYLRSVQVREYEDIEVVLRSDTKIMPANEDLDLNALEGAIVGIYQPSGLVKRCPVEDCSRILSDGDCAEHGAVDGEYDLRVKAVLDVGDCYETIYLNERMLADFANLSLDDALEHARNSLDESIVLRRLRERLIGRHVHVEGDRTDAGLIVSAGYQLGYPKQAEIDEVAAQLERVRV